MFPSANDAVVANNPPAEVQGTSGWWKFIGTLEQLQELEGRVNAALDGVAATTVKISGDLAINGNWSTFTADDYGFLSKVEEITGKLWFESWTPPSGLTGLSLLFNVQSIGNLDIRHGRLASLTGLENITSIPSGINIYNTGQLTNFTGLDNLQSVTGGITVQRGGWDGGLTGLGSLTSLDSLTVFTKGSGNLTSLAGMSSLQSINGNMSIYLNSQLTTVADLNVTYIGGKLTYYDNPLVDPATLYAWIGTLNATPGGVTDSIEWFGNTYASRQAVLDHPNGTLAINDTGDGRVPLTANTAALGDVHGLGAFSYQWNGGGAAIDGATSSTYTLTQADVGLAITVTVSYTDGQGTAETVTSAPTATVTSAVPSVVPGDVDNDGQTNNLDITPFITALQIGGSIDDPSQVDAFLAQVPAGSFAGADASADGLVNNLDITPFIGLLSQSVSAVSASHAAVASVQRVEPLTAILATAAVRRPPLPRPAAYTHPLGDTGSSDPNETVDIFAGL